MSDRRLRIDSMKSAGRSPLSLPSSLSLREPITPLLDRLVNIQFGVRRRHGSADLMAADLSRQTGLQAGCCQAVIAGYPWGMEEAMFGADHEPARSVLRRLGLGHWHMRCDETFCFIDMR